MTDAFSRVDLFVRGQRPLRPALAVRPLHPALPHERADIALLRDGEEGVGHRDPRQHLHQGPPRRPEKVSSGEIRDLH